MVLMGPMPGWGRRNLAHGRGGCSQGTLYTFRRVIQAIPWLVNYPTVNHPDKLSVRRPTSRAGRRVVERGIGKSRRVRVAAGSLRRDIAA